ncbi:putative amidase [Teratosphaeria nubilosa]|uniref:Putative amidase n=1 Tax=Teratosphaeria nubilosa TaxID=161662 RepID=A0A6G1L5E9_9PEZI|nr:putative amidase [Teratosphaeria nubilosa]
MAATTNGTVSHDEVLATAASIGYTIPDDEVAEYADLLAKAKKAFESVAAMEDYQPQPDWASTPRSAIHFPDPKDNPLNAWAWKFTCRHKNPVGRLLDGKSICLKDNIAVAGVPCLVGTDSFTGWTPTTDATVATRILEQGGVIVGKAVCENLSRGAVSVTAATGPVHNPYARGYSAGGSSSGTAALVASGAVDMGIGCDQGGSVRIPAALCGLWGFKATFGLVPYSGIVSNDASVDFVGPIARRARECARLLEGIAGVDGWDDRQGAGTPGVGEVERYEVVMEGGVRGMRIGVLREGVELEVMDEGVRATFERACEVWRRLGAVVEEVSVPAHEQARVVYAVWSKMGNHMGMLGRATGRRQVMLTDLHERKNLPYTPAALDQMSVMSKEGLLAGEYAWRHYASAYPKSINLGRKLKAAYDAALQAYDVLVMPTCATPADPLPGVHASPAVHMGRSVGKLENTCPFNATGHPALAFPIGSVAVEGGRRLPVSMQVVGRWWGEGVVLRVARAWEREVGDWKSF